MKIYPWLYLVVHAGLPTGLAKKSQYENELLPFNPTAKLHNQQINTLQCSLSRYTCQQVLNPFILWAYRTHIPVQQTVK